jgi:antitoxin component YwqK of YwqJK toxin-antitoxin module
MEKEKNIIFEGEYLNGEKLNSKCKIFYDNDQLKFEGEFINGNPKGKFYNSNGIMIFEGEYSKGKEWNGKAKEYKDDKLIFEGEFINGKKLGKNIIQKEN